MNNNSSDIITQVKASVQQLYGERLSKVILYGSYASSKERNDSDIDFLIVLKDKNISVFKEIEKLNEQLYELILKNGKLISFIPTTEDKFRDSPNPLYRQIRKYGKTV